LTRLPLGDVTMCIGGRLFYPAREAVLSEARPPPTAGSFRTASARYPTENHITWWALPSVSRLLSLGRCFLADRLQSALAAASAL